MSISTQLKECKAVLEIFIFLVVVQSSRCWIWVRIKSTQLIHITQLKVIFLRTCTWKHLLHGATQLMNDGHNRMIKLVTKFICVLPCLMQYLSYKDEFILKLYIFLDIFNHRREIWLDNVNKLSCPFKLFNKITCFWAQIKSTFLPEQQTALAQLLINIECRIWFLRKAEKLWKCRWLIKRTKNEFHVNL